MTAGDRTHGIIAGTGFGTFAAGAREQRVATRFGEPSGPLATLQFGEHAVFFVPRHGPDLLIPASAVNYRANLAALESLGVERVIALHTVGVIAENIEPGRLAVPHQLIDYTWGREQTIYDDMRDLRHVELTEPFSAELRADLLSAGAAAGVDVVAGGVYAVTQGPRLETAAEVDKLERDGADYVGMTAMPEAGLARELDMEYASLSLVVNYAAGRSEQSIHADIEINVAAARSAAEKLLATYFGVPAE